ncbi:CDP-alcohol phosphatidyltransferase family protein [Cellulomonas iranensis]|uniref:CDP-diacylglycerol--serine O-phosphatidyltransferase n=1 Tax=Cellulomonas iranensis TaxID=76862 RepID=A0ABU0GH72_9CELL|nr:CDP-alcohol phosphatidyltransferase family protein [Cellulomonas iranensis]MDQ0424648.1 CDP-diacylglycerol--serine O-phosphatidyltransferase [Cellulomonas iranensis]
MSAGLAESTSAPTITSLLRDPANLVTVLGLVSGLAGVHAAVTGSFALAAALGVLAVVLDCVDGPVARRTRERPAYMSRVGTELDSLADVVCSGVGPAVLVAAVASWHPGALAAAVVVVVASTVRLAYFNAFGLADGAFTGLPVFYSPFVLGAVLAAAWLVTPRAAGAAGAVTLVVLALLNVSTLRVPKLRGRWFTGFMVAATLLIGLLVVLALTEVDR